jgi:ech hydrogenase subunit D
MASDAVEGARAAPPPRIPGLEKQPITVVTRERLVAEVGALKAGGHRLVQIECTKIDAAHELTYSFDLASSFSSLRVLVAPGEEVPSVSGVYWAAFAYENEIHDLFGIAFPGLVVDYRGAFYRTRVKTPFEAPLGRRPTPSGLDGAATPGSRPAPGSRPGPSGPDEAATPSGADQAATPGRRPTPSGADQAATP